MIYVVPKSNEMDQHCVQVRDSAARHLGIQSGSVKAARIFEFKDYTLNDEEKYFVQNHLVNSIVNSVFFTNQYSEINFQSYCVVSKKPGITDDESRCAEKTFEDRFSKVSPKVSTHYLYMFENKLAEEDFEKVASTLLGNPLIHNFSYSWNSVAFASCERKVSTAPAAFQEKRKVNPFDLALNQEEVSAIEAHLSKDEVRKMRAEKGLSELTDCEWEIIGQTWSEHCKHKEFNAEIHYKDLDTGESKVVDSLFKSKIKKSTDEIDKAFKEKGNSFLVKVFNDNAGVVRIDDESLFVWKVETHNTPSALDPYGGAITGVLGVNRDAMGTGVGGARLLFNTNVLCFGKPDYKKPLLKGQKHPLYIREGVVRGVRDAGNHSGVPTVNGSVIYDDRYSGKPLVFCGTGAVLPKHYASQESWGKYVDAGDIIVMVGGRVGKDGIHGATASSTHTDESTPTTIVQIGSPLTQKLLSDFLEYVTRKGLVKSCTDNGAGGLSSSIGELAEFAGGARVHLERVPLKYPGLEPWEIFVSESQERMTLVCSASQIPQLKSIADGFEVELTAVGEFTNTGVLEVYFEEKVEAYLDLNFLHHGVPRKTLYAEWAKPTLVEPILSEMGERRFPRPPMPPSPLGNFLDDGHNRSLLELLASDNICSRRNIIRQYDHEVKGRSILKPLMGENQNAPQDAGVMRLSFEHYRGIAVSNGIIPRYGDIDAYQMSAGSFDEAVRQIIAVGGKLPDPEDKEPSFWSVNDNFCVPNVVYDPVHNTDGKTKLAKLVQMCDALYDMATFFKIPMTSGKDSMKNDFGTGKDKISVPPTILYSMVAGIEDVRKTLSSEWKNPGDLIYQIGKTYNELGASEFYALFGELGANVPVVRPEAAKRIYTQFSKAHQMGLLNSAHDLSDGGLSVALAESCIGSGKGARIQIANSELSVEALLFSESHSRFVVSISKENKAAFENIMGSDLLLLGEVSGETFLHCTMGEQTLLHCSVEQMKKAWERELA